MTRMYEGDSEQVTTRVQREWSLLSVPCQWGWMTAGIRFSSTCQISREEHTEQTTLKHLEYRYVSPIFKTKFWSFINFLAQRHCHYSRIIEM